MTEAHVRSQPRNAGATRDRVAKILLVEDDASVRAAVRRALRSNGHDVIDTKSAEDAMMAWKEHGGVFDCVVSDVVMPGLHGPQLVSRLREDRPELPVLFISGFAGQALRGLDLDVPNTLFLQKPFDPAQLAAAIAELRRISDGNAPPE
jgi:two-component system cell cycle sensor histidine kinase/response regulator CckA